MAAFGGAVMAGAAGSASFVQSGNLNVTGTDLALVIGASETGNASPALTCVWDPAGNNESMTGTFATVSQGTYVDATLQYLDDPTAANAPVRVNAASAVEDMSVGGMFFTAAANIVGTDQANTSGATPSSLSVNVPNVVTGDMVCDFTVCGHSTNPTLTVGALQTERGGPVTPGNYTSASMSTQLGSSGNQMSWSYSGANYGAILLAARIPDSGGGPPADVSQPFPSRVYGVKYKTLLGR